MIWLTCLLLATSWEWHVEGSLYNNIGCWPTGILAIDAQGKSLALAGRDSRLWILEPNREPRLIALGDLKARKVAIGDREIVIYGRRNGANTLAVFDQSSGALLRERTLASAVKNLQWSEDYLVAVVYLPGNQPMVQELDPLTLETERAFFKPTEALRRFPNFASLWVDARKDVWAILSQVSPKLYFATEARIRLESDRSDELPNSLPYINLELGPEYVPPLTKFFRGTHVRDDTKGMVEAFQDWFSSTRIVYFGALGDGYVVCYEAPDQVEGLLIGNHLAIRLLDERFQPVGPLWKRYGQIAGIGGEKIFIAYPNGPEPIPGEPGAIARHYGLEEITDQSALVDLYRRYRKVEQKTHHILVEAFTPEAAPVIE